MIFTIHGISSRSLARHGLETFDITRGLISKFAMKNLLVTIFVTKQVKPWQDMIKKT